MSIVIDELVERINQQKKELIQIVEVTGLNSPDAICCSQKLDKLITIYQTFSYKERKKIETCCGRTIQSFEN
jgi:stage 0 sporulation regulatory protein